MFNKKSYIKLNTSNTISCYFENSLEKEITIINLNLIGSLTFKVIEIIKSNDTKVYSLNAISVLEDKSNSVLILGTFNNKNEAELAMKEILFKINNNKLFNYLLILSVIFSVFILLGIYSINYFQNNKNVTKDNSFVTNTLVNKDNNSEKNAILPDIEDIKNNLPKVESNQTPQLSEAELKIMFEKIQQQQILESQNKQVNIEEESKSQTVNKSEADKLLEKLN